MKNFVYYVERNQEHICPRDHNIGTINIIIYSLKIKSNKKALG